MILASLVFQYSWSQSVSLTIPPLGMVVLKWEGV